MSRILFLLHGMGVHGGDWATTVQTKLSEVAARYPELSTGESLEQRIKLVPVTYDHVFADVLEQWNGSVDALHASASESGIAVPGVLSWLGGASETERNFFWSHVVDVLLYRFFSLITKQVRLHVMQQIASTLTAEMADGRIVEASVLAHSLGTAVAHDSLALLATLPLEGSEAFLVGNFRFTNLFTLANVSRVLETDPLPYASPVHPVSLDPATAYLTRYYTFRHSYDPIPAVRCFQPANWGRGLRIVDGLELIRDFNVHAFEHYLDTPHVHIPILNALLGPTIGQDRKAEAEAEYAAAPGPPCSQVVSGFKSRVRQMIDLIGGTSDPRNLIVAASQFLALAKEASDAC